MAVKQILPGLYALPLGVVNAFLIETGNTLTLIDTGSPGDGEAILAAVREIGRQPADVRHILVTHCHPDHAGSLAVLKRETGAAAWMHPRDAAMVRAGKAMRPLVPGPGLVNKFLYRIIIQAAKPTIEPAEIERELFDRDELPLAGGIQAIHLPGHCQGQLAFLWAPHRGVFFAADACANVFGLGLSPAYEDLDQGRRDLAKLATYEFDVAVFGHGRPILQDAAERFRKKWAG